MNKNVQWPSHFSDEFITLVLEADYDKRLINRRYNTVNHGHCTKDFRNKNDPKYKFLLTTNANKYCQLSVPN